MLEKIRMRAILKENAANYISLERLIKVDFEKKKGNCQFLNSANENCKNDRKNDHASFNQINDIGLPCEQRPIKIQQISVNFGLNFP